jgi:hypothetical protein
MHGHHPRDFAHIVVDWIAFGHTPRRERMANVMDVVQRHHRLQACQPGSHHLRPAAEPRKEVRFNEAGRDAHVGVEPRRVEEHLNARRGHAHASER